MNTKALVTLALALAACSSTTGPADAPDVPVDAPQDHAPETPGLLPHGSACEDHEECEGGLCITGDLDPAFEGGYCSGPCDPLDPSACGPAGHCFSVDVAPPICGAACEDDLDCDPPRTRCVGTCVPSAFVADVEPAGVVVGSWEASLPGVVASVDPDRVLQRVRILSGDLPWDSPAGPVTIRSRAAGHPDHALAVEYLLSVLASMALDATVVPYDGGVNVVADLSGGDPSKGVVVVAAHYDSIASDTSGWDPVTGPAPGANDNATGVAVALEVADALRIVALPYPRHPIRLVLFDGEETGMTGSSAWVAGLGGGDVACALNVDMVGASTAAMDGRFWAQLDEATSLPMASIATEAIAKLAPGARPAWTAYSVTWSDSASFWDAGICSVGLFAWPRPPANHTVLDVAAGIDGAFLADVARAAVATAAAWKWLAP
jgi:Iap family predicted aminopeptidase